MATPRFSFLIISRQVNKLPNLNQGPPISVQQLFLGGIAKNIKKINKMHFINEQYRINSHPLWNKAVKESTRNTQIRKPRNGHVIFLLFANSIRGWKRKTFYSLRFIMKPEILSPSTSWLLVKNCFQ